MLFAIGQRPDTEPKGTFGNPLELNLRFEVEQALQRQTEELTHVCTRHSLGLHESIETVRRQNPSSTSNLPDTLFLPPDTQQILEKPRIRQLFRPQPSIF